MFFFPHSAGGFWSTSYSWECRIAPASGRWTLDLGLCHSVAWLDLTWSIFPSPNTGRVSKVHLKNTSSMVCSSCSSSRVRFNDASFPLCGLRRGQKSRKGLESWRTFELLPPARELCRSIFPPWDLKELSRLFCGIVEYPFLCTGKMKGLGVCDCSGGSSSYWESFIYFFFFALVASKKMLIIISIVISTNSLRAYVNIKCVISTNFPILWFFLSKLYCYEQGNFWCAETMLYF